jgi:hypothetical protein
MTILFIGLGLIIYSRLYSWILKVLKANSSLGVASIYIILGVLAASIAVYFNFKASSTGDFTVYLMCAIGAIVRTGYSHFKLQKASLNT